MTVPLPSGRGSFTGTFDLTKQLGFILNVTAGVDVNSGIATWLLTAIDPYTGLPTTDPALSILPLGQSGTVGYTIEAVSTATTGTVLDAAARVIYDSQQPLDSGIVTATLDAVPPATSFSVADLGGGQYYVQWQATDDAGGSGVANSTVYVSLDGGVWQPVDQYATNGSFTYQAAAGVTAQFLVLSADNAGNVEPAPGRGAGALLRSRDQPGQLAHAAQRAGAALGPCATQPSTNPLFLQAQQGVPTPQPKVNPPAFATVLEPFNAAALVWGPRAQRAVALGIQGENRRFDECLARQSWWASRSGPSACHPRQYRRHVTARPDRRSQGLRGIR